ncbi:MAG: oligopeptide transporter, OPT family [Paucibacter sp.]|nr:oligopeptide transporter, OPT family [Roseateles sp.]
MRAQRRAFVQTNTPREITLRGLLLGAVITLLFTAANVYFGLKAGLTFATSIPAAVISMALLSRFKDVSIQENNIVQTVASSAGAISSIIFVLPGLIMVGWWQGFPYWTCVAICALGGTLGVMYSIPLRRALVTQSDLPYPEGLACAEVLKVGQQAQEARGSAAGDQAASETAKGLKAIVMGALASAAMTVTIQTQVFAGEVVRFFRVGSGASGINIGLSFALLAVGHMIGLWAGLAMLLGAAIAWVGAVPMLSASHELAAVTDPATLAQTVWKTQVRYIGAGAIGVAAIWTLIKLAKPVLGGLKSALAASRARGEGQSLALVEQDMPIGWMAGITAACMLPIAALLYGFGTGAGLAAQAGLLTMTGVVYVLLMSFFVAAVCGYMAGLVGSSNSPISGVGILVVLGAAALIVFLVKPLLPPELHKALVAFALFVTAVIVAVAVIANDNLQDLKTGQLVGATPWRQQAVLVFGVVMGSLVVPPVLDLLNKAYGFAGAPGADAAKALAAPQAALISALAKGVIDGGLDWSLIGTGAGLGVVLIALDGVLRRSGTKATLPPLAVGLGIYLPTSVTLMTVIGAVVGAIWNRRAEKGPRSEAAKHLGVLLASGLIVGEGLMGVLFAALVVLSGKDAPIGLVGPGWGETGVWLGALGFALAVAGLYRWLAKLHRA